MTRLFFNKGLVGQEHVKYFALKFLGNKPKCVWSTHQWKLRNIWNQKRKQMEKSHTSYYAQDPRKPRRAKRHVCQKCPNYVFQVHNRNKHHPCKIPTEDQSPYCLYIVVAISDNLSDQIAHAKVCSSYHYEQKKLKEKRWPKVVKFVQPGNIINNSDS